MFHTNFPAAVLYFTDADVFLRIVHLTFHTNFSTLYYGYFRIHRLLRGFLNFWSIQPLLKFISRIADVLKLPSTFWVFWEILEFTTYFGNSWFFFVLLTPLEIFLRFILWSANSFGNFWVFISRIRDLLGPQTIWDWIFWVLPHRLFGIEFFGSPNSFGEFFFRPQLLLGSFFWVQLQSIPTPLLIFKEFSLNGGIFRAY